MYNNQYIKETRYIKKGIITNPYLLSFTLLLGLSLLPSGILPEFIAIWLAFTTGIYGSIITIFFFLWAKELSGQHFISKISNIRFNNFIYISR